MSGKRSAVLLALLLACGAAHAACPASECDYQEPHYAAAFHAWLDCITPFVDQYIAAGDKMAVLYPRFGIAWRALATSEEEQKRSPEKDIGAAARRLFEDRILRTAEPEALQLFNLMELKLKQQTQRCGPMPEPPRKQ